VTDRHRSAAINPAVPNSARVWNYLLGGKDNFAADRAAADQFSTTFPPIVQLARASRAFLVRSVTWLAREAGVRQFIDVGSGLPTADNTHEVAQRAASDARIVYVDNDPLVLAHARALLVGNAEGATAYVEADMRDTDTILGEAGRTLDLTRPTALLFMRVLGHVPDTEEACGVVQRLLAGLPSGSYLAVCDGTNTAGEAAMDQAEDEYRQSGAVPYRSRGAEELASFFDGLELVEPGLVPLSRWRPVLVAVEPRLAAARVPGAQAPDELYSLGGVARKP